MTRAIMMCGLMMLGLCAGLTAPAATVRTATETFVTNKIAQAIAALPPAQTDLTPATNYTDSATNALAGTIATIPRIEESLVYPGVARYAEDAYRADTATYAEGAATADWTTKLAGQTQSARDGDAIFAQLDAAASAAQVTNIVRSLSLGGIWDSSLQIWWTPRMVNGSLTYHATTNVNLSAEN